MPYLIVGLIAVLLVGLIVGGVVTILTYLTAFLALPSLAAMRIVQSLGLTGPGWYVVLHALAGAALGLLAHRLFGNPRRRPSAGGKTGGLRSFVAGRRWVKVVLIVILVIVFFNLLPGMLSLLRYM